jgi:CheY-like chemotaxis protein
MAAMSGRLVYQVAGPCSRSRFRATGRPVPKHREDVRTMNRLLMVDDDPLTVKMVTKRLKRLFPEALIVTATTANEAEETIQRYVTRRMSFDAAILDLYLPYNGKLKPSLFLCSLLSRSMDDVFVVHFTAYDEDAELRAHLNDVHLKGYGQRGPFQPKNSSWPKELSARLASVHIVDGLRRLRAQSPSDRFNGRIAGSFYDVNDFMVDVRRLWPDLNDEARRKVSEYFDVSEEDGRVRVVLGGRA